MSKSFAFAAARKVGNGVIQEALQLGQSSNYSRDDCIWKMDTDTCSKSTLKFTLYTKYVILQRYFQKMRLNIVSAELWLLTKGSVAVSRTFAVTKMAAPLQIRAMMRTLGRLKWI